MLQRRVAMSAPARAPTTKKDGNERSHCDTDSGPSVMAIIFGVVGAAAAVGIGYLMGREIERCNVEDESEHKQSYREPPRPRGSTTAAISSVGATSAGGRERRAQRVRNRHFM